MCPFLHPAQIFTCKTTYLVNSTSFSKQRPLRAFQNSSAFRDIALQRPLFFSILFMLQSLMKGLRDPHHKFLNIFPVPVWYKAEPCNPFFPSLSTQLHLFWKKQSWDCHVQETSFIPYFSVFHAQTDADSLIGIQLISIGQTSYCPLLHLVWTSQQSWYP